MTEEPAPDTDTLNGRESLGQHKNVKGTWDSPCHAVCFHMCCIGCIVLRMYVSFYSLTECYLLWDC